MKGIRFGNITLFATGLMSGLGFDVSELFHVVRQKYGFYCPSNISLMALIDCFEEADKPAR